MKVVEVVKLPSHLGSLARRSEHFALCPLARKIDLLQQHIEAQAEDRGVTVIGQSTQ
jgi:hypothetical protein